MRKDLVGFDRFMDGPFNLVKEFDKDFGRLFESLYSQRGVKNFGALCDIEEKENSFVVTLDVPGVLKKDIAIEVQDGRLTVSGERREENEGATYRERAFGKFSRTLHLGNGINQDGIDAKYDNGVLTITVPKSQEKIAKKIQIS